jgi:hypothetical protein
VPQGHAGSKSARGNGDEWDAGALVCLSVTWAVVVPGEGPCALVCPSGVRSRPRFSSFACQARGIAEGDTVIVGEFDFEWSDDQSEGRLYDAWLSDRKARGRVAQGSARWPHMGG